MHYEFISNKNTMKYCSILKGIFGINLLIISFFGSCNGQSNAIQQCDSSYKNANIMITNYGKSSNKEFLQKAINSLDTSLKCETTKAKSINLKITIYFLLEDYKSGSAFIDSLQITDFNKPYKKKMFSNIFKASQLNFIGDSAGSKLIYSNIVSDINQFLQKSSREILDKEAYGSLIFAESKYLTVSEISKQIDTLKMKFPNDSAFMDMLRKQYILPPKDDF